MKPWVYVRENLIAGLRTSPFKVVQVWWILPIYAVLALILGWSTGFLRFAPLDSRLAWVLPFTMILTPSLVEEALFRGLLLPRDTGERGIGVAAIWVCVNTALFVAWHPLVALARPAVADVFNDPAFLAVVALLGLACGAAYLWSRSLWVPVILHWATVVPWALWMGGRNIILEV